MTSTRPKHLPATPVNALSRRAHLLSRTPPCARKLLAAAAGLLLLSGCATQTPMLQEQSPPELVVPHQSTNSATSAEATAPLQTPAASPELVAQASQPTPAGSTVIELVGTPDPNDRTPTIGQPLDPLDPDRPLTPSGQERIDLWQRIRDGFAMPDLGNDLVRDHERWYASRPDYVQRMTDRGSRYLYHIVEEVTRRGMPTELALLPFIESAFNPQAHSVAKASGMWQFIPSTGRDYDLKQNIFRDDRRDVLASTRAALDYLSRLSNMFGGDWQLALASYNWGEGNVRKAILRNQRLGLPTDYESLNMPNETRNYIPKLQAVKNIVLNPASYGLGLPALENHPYFISVPIQRDIDTALAARLAGLSLGEFTELNPSMKKPVILAAGTPQVLLPYDNAERFTKRLAGHTGAMATWTAWVAPRTLKPTEAAQMVGMDEDSLRSVNNIPARMLIKAGSTLLVPRSPHRDQDVSEHLADNAQIQLAADVPPLRRVSIRAGKSDTLASLARKHKINPAQLAQWNNLSASSRLKPGQSLVMYQANAKVKAAGGRMAAKARGQKRNVAATKAKTRIAASSNRKPARANSRRTARVD